MDEIYKTIQDAVDSLASELNYRISTGLRDEVKYGESIVYEYAEVETDEEDCYEVKLEVKYDEWGGGPAPDDDPWKMYVNDVSLYIDGTYTDLSRYGLTYEDFQF